ncbi:MAG: hypothetical protein DMG76_28810 [Acidobacteria bacterium]|nr:MAG: hypothetical protein DMG76_28810 [Acidobacteriota bacterium]
MVDVWQSRGTVHLLNQMDGSRDFVSTSKSLNPATKIEQPRLKGVENRAWFYPSPLTFCRLKRPKLPVVKSSPALLH